MTVYIENDKQVDCQMLVSAVVISTHILNQQFQEPFETVVIDPTRTISVGKVNLGTFRSYPKVYKPPDEGPSDYQTISLNKIEDFWLVLQRILCLRNLISNPLWIVNCLSSVE